MAEIRNYEAFLTDSELFESTFCEACFNAHNDLALNPMPPMCHHRD